MTRLYSFKLVKSGREVEVYRYKDHAIKRGYKRRHKVGRRNRPINIVKPADEANLSRREFYEYQLEVERIKVEGLSPEQKLIKRQFSIGRTRTNIRRLVNANPQLNKFLTLTFAQSMPDLNNANYLFNQAVKRITRKQPDFEYIAVVEFQKDIDYYGRKKENGGSVHYHLLCNMETPSGKSVKEIFDWEKWFASRYWKNGFIKIKDVGQIKNMGAYFCKYLGKDMADQRMFGKKKFFCSRKLNKPVEFISAEAVRFYQSHVSGLEPVFQKTFHSDYAGKISYSAYTLPDDVLLS